MGKIEDAIWTMAEPLVLENGMELIDVEYVKEGAEWYLRLFLDKEGDEGIDLDDCELISRKFSDILEEKDPITQAYRLEVSSPGIERPLKRTKDFQRFQGEKVQVKTFSEVEGKKQFIGILQETTEETVTLDVDGTSIAIPRKQIGKANLVWEF
ncbi:MAG: ribosome maturation factor RimP [Firmicutes bacterium]|jgi:ribosome maturation factor RimP|nr:ribosome maturation factor RimP [Peptococcaceae bacterium]MBR5488714.1 ribosome maturation factor RimP [Bacillota bacterium]MBQ2015360.1 ribosome maturation factor RimP [Peptococcaceae bacterium]MBQ2035946.1 ribosome maturation factor RimP [Peptococcaceae bacterium]MBQ5683941.1 ribosome maturation factor RimP [Peptococcaceae bacterium]